MLIFIARRLAMVCVMSLVMSVLVFGVTQVLPGDVTTMVLGQFATEAAKQELREELGLTRSLPVQYGTWITGFVRGDWGISISSQAPVFNLVMERLRNSLMLGFVGLMMFAPLGILLGLVAGLKQNSWTDHFLSVGSLGFIGLPEFVSGLILIWVFAVQLGWLPASSAIPAGTGFVDAFPKLILPGVTVALAGLAYVLRMTRASTVEVLRRDYVRTARLKGLPVRAVVFTHILRNALTPTVTVIAVSIGWLVGGLIVTESVFGYPGLGRLALFAIQRRDLPLMQATTMVIVVITMLANLVADVIYTYLNPTIRY
jgi:peptide/nickel transport system permease protein